MPSVLEIIVTTLPTLNDPDLENFRTQVDNEFSQRRLTQLSRQELTRLRSTTEAAIWRRRAPRYRDEDAITLDLLRSEQGDLLDRGWSQDPAQLTQQVDRRSAIRDRIRYYEERERLLSDEEQDLLRQRREDAETRRKARDREWKESNTPYIPQGLSLEALHYRLGSATRAAQAFHDSGNQKKKFEQELLRIRIRRIVQDTLHPENRIPQGMSEDQAIGIVGDALFPSIRVRFPGIEATAGVVLQLMQWDVEDVVPMLTDDEYLDEMVPKAISALERKRERVEWGAEAGLF